MVPPTNHRGKESIVKKLIVVLAVALVPALTACKSSPTEPDPEEQTLAPQVIEVGLQLG